MTLLWVCLIILTCLIGMWYFAATDADLATWIYEGSGCIHGPSRCTIAG